MRNITNDRAVQNYLRDVSYASTGSLKGALASTTATATTTPQIKNVIGRVRKNKRAARAACAYEQVHAVLCKTTT